MIGGSQVSWELKPGTYYDPAATGNQPDLDYTTLVGRELEFPDINQLASGVDPANWPLRSAAPVRYRVVRNGSGGVLTAPAKKACLIDVANPGSVTALAAVADIRKEYHLCDPYIVGDIPAGALFLVVVRGRALWRTSSSGADFPLAARAGDFLIPNATGGYPQTFPATDQDSAGTNRDHMLLIRYTRIRTLAAVPINTVDTDIDVIVDQQ